MAKATQITLDQLPSTVSTTDGTSTVIIMSVPAFAAANGGQEITFDVVGHDFTNNETASAKISVKLKNVSSTPTMIGTPVHLIPINVGSSPGLQTASVNVVISGTSLHVTVIGVAGRTIYWSATRWPSVQVLDGYTATNPITLTGLAGGGDLTGNFPTWTVNAINGTGLGSTIDVNTNFDFGVPGASAVKLTWKKTAVNPEIRQYDMDSTTNNPGTVGTPMRITAQAGQQSTAGQGGTGGPLYLTAGAGGLGSITDGTGGSVILAGGTSNSVRGSVILMSGAVTQLTIGPSHLLVQNIGNAEFQLGADFIVDLNGAGGYFTLTDAPVSAGAVGGAASLPANPVGFMNIRLNGAIVKIPYYAS